MAELRHIVAANISALRKKSGMTQLEMAEKLCYTDKAISKWERGESVPDIEVLKKIADLFDVDVNFLISDGKSVSSHDVKKTSKTRIHVVVTLLSTLLVWLLATIGFVAVSYSVSNPHIKWLAFVYAVPVSLLVFLIMNSIWFNKRWNYFIISLMMWTVLISVCLSIYVISSGLLNPWLVTVLGIPGQIIIIAWSRMRGKPLSFKRKSDSSKEG